MKESLKIKNRIAQIDLIDIDIKIKEIVDASNRINKLKNTHDLIWLNDGLSFKDSRPNRLFDFLREIPIEVKDYIHVLTDSDIDQSDDPVGFAQLLKRRRRALQEVNDKLKKDKKKLLRIRTRILRSTYSYNTSHDYRQDLKRVLRKNMPLSIDEEGIGSIKLRKSFKLLNALIELINNKNKFSSKWKKVRYWISLNEYWSRKNFLTKIELH